MGELKVESVFYGQSFNVASTTLYAGSFLVGSGQAESLGDDPITFFIFTDPKEKTLQFALFADQALQLAAAIIEQAKETGRVTSYQIIVPETQQGAVNE